jgi:hypothetical protein
LQLLNEIKKIIVKSTTTSTERKICLCAGDLLPSFDVMDMDVNGHQPPVSIWMEVPGIHSFATIYRFWKEAIYPISGYKNEENIVVARKNNHVVE